MPIKLAVGLPAYRGIIASGQAKMFMEIGAALAKSKEAIQLIMIADIDVCGVDRARNMLVAHAMKQGADWLLMVDSDTWVDAGQDLIRMVIEAPQDAALVGAAVRVRGTGALNVFRVDDKTDEMVAITADEMTTIKLGTSKRYEEVDAIGGAVIAINLHRIHNVDFRWRYKENGRSVSEDINFCQNLRAFDEKVYLDTRVHTKHVDKAGVLST